MAQFWINLYPRIYEIMKFILSLIRILHIYDVDQLFRTRFFRDNAGIRDKINA